MWEPEEFAALRDAFAQRTGTQAADWHLVFKARYGMREVFSALRGTHGDGEVVTTLFTGCTAVDSIIAAGLSPRYATINPATLGMDAGELTVGPKTRAVLFQHSYGMIDGNASLIAAAKAHEAGALFVEDSAHCLARMALKEDGTPAADVSIHSFGIEKTFSNLYFGGALWVNPHMEDKAAHEAITQALTSLEPLPARLDQATQHYHTHVRILSHLPAPIREPLRARMIASGSFEPPVAEVERLGGLPYESYAPSAWIVRQILQMFKTLDEDEPRRVACADRYRELLADWRADLVPEAAFSAAVDQPLIRFPLVLPTEELSFEVRQTLLQAGHYAVDWYRMPFYPGSLDVTRYGVTQQEVDDYHAKYAGTIGLPADMDPSQVDDCVRAVCASMGA